MPSRTPGHEIRVTLVRTYANGRRSTIDGNIAIAWADNDPEPLNPKAALDHALMVVRADFEGNDIDHLRRTT